MYGFKVDECVFELQNIRDWIITARTFELIILLPKNKPRNILRKTKTNESKKRAKSHKCKKQDRHLNFLPNVVQQTTKLRLVGSLLLSSEAMMKFSFMLSFYRVKQQCLVHRNNKKVSLDVTIEFLTQLWRLASKSEVKHLAVSIWQLYVDTLLLSLMIWLVSLSTVGVNTMATLLNHLANM